MDVLQQIVSAYRPTIPTDCETARAIDRGASTEEICANATSDGLHAFAAALFSADVEVVQAGSGAKATDQTLLDDIDRVLADYQHRLPPNCETVRLIRRGAQLELISEAAQAEGLQDLVAVLFEAEQEQFRNEEGPQD